MLQLFDEQHLMIRYLKIAHVPWKVEYLCYKVSHHKILITFSLTNTIFMTQHKGSQMFHGFLWLNVTRFGDGGAVRPQVKFIYMYEHKIQHKIILSFLLLKGTFVTWQMGRKSLLATSNESLIFENQIKKEACGKQKELIFVIFRKTHWNMLYKNMSENKTWIRVKKTHSPGLFISSITILLFLSSLQTKTVNVIVGTWQVPFVPRLSMVFSNRARTYLRPL
jgi:hypothetical protein